MLEAVFTRLCFDRTLQYSIVSTSLALHLIMESKAQILCDVSS